MGTWSNKPVGNDTASDWAWSLVGPAGVELVRKTIKAATTSNGPLDLPTAEEGVAAAAVIAGAASDPVRGLPVEIKTWILEQGYVPDLVTVEAAIHALDLVLDSSELRETWAETDGLTGWSNSNLAVKDRLQAAIDDDLPTREPKPPTIPRLLYKLIERYERTGEHELIQHIDSKLDKLEDINRPTSATGHQLPLVLVCRVGLLDQAKLLLARGANPNGSEGADSSPIGAACKSSNPRILRLLIDAGAELIHEHQPLGDREPHKYMPALIVAAMHGVPDMLSLLEEFGANLAYRSINGENLLWFAAHAGNLRVVNYLIEGGFSPNDMGGYHEPALFAAVRGGYVQVVKTLVEAGADVGFVDSWGGRAIDYAGESKAIRQLLTSG